MRIELTIIGLVTSMFVVLMIFDVFQLVVTPLAPYGILLRRMMN